jgi:pyridoxal phosphate enzyme (YggS family)
VLLFYQFIDAIKNERKIKYMQLDRIKIKPDPASQSSLNQIKESVCQIIKTLPPDVQIVAAAKTRLPEEVQSAITVGIKVIGYNYVQEAEKMFHIVGSRVQWHMIGHLQRNKAKKAVKIFDMIETIDSLKLAETVDYHCVAIGKIMPVLIEINSGKESNKTGVLLGEIDELVRAIGALPNLKVQGLMTMGPRFGNPEDARPYFRATKSTFDRLKLANIKNIEMRFLSMGMSNSYQIAIEEGANVVRIGNLIFGERYV